MTSNISSSSHGNISGSQPLVSRPSSPLYPAPIAKTDLVLGSLHMQSTTHAKRPIITICTQNNQGDVPGAVRNLLLSTKRLQELLRQWGLRQATEGQVSDAYVQIGTDFNVTIRAFGYHRIDLSDIHTIPNELRTVLEQCLGEDPSPAILEAYMPEVRKVLYKLLKGLQSRQDAWRAAGGQIPFDTR